MRTPIATLVLLVLGAGCNKDEDARPENPSDSPYEVEIDPADFVSDNVVGNVYFPLTAPKTYTYEGVNEDDQAVKVEEAYLDETRLMMGVTCRVVRAREWHNDELVEDTFDWYAQDVHGNVWYFGEDTKEIDHGNVASTEGSWEAGVDGARPGVIMPANIISGMWYRQEYYKGKAEDVAQVLGLHKTVTVPFGTFNDCIETAEWSALEPGVVEHKTYAAGVGQLRAEAVKANPVMKTSCQ